MLLAVGAVSVWLVNRIEQDAGWVAHTLEVENRLSELRFSMRRSESGERGYLLTGDRGYLETYQNGVTEASAALAEARRMTADNPAQQSALDALEPVIRERLAQMAQVIRREQQGDREGALAIVRDPGGRALVEDIADRVTRMQASEERLLQERSAHFRRSSRYLLAAVLAGTLLIVALAFLSNALVRRSNIALRETSARSPRRTPGSRRRSRSARPICGAARRSKAPFCSRPSTASSPSRAKAGSSSGIRHRSEPSAIRARRRWGRIWPR